MVLLKPLACGILITAAQTDTDMGGVTWKPSYTPWLLTFSEQHATCLSPDIAHVL